MTFANAVSLNRPESRSRCHWTNMANRPNSASRIDGTTTIGEIIRVEARSVKVKPNADTKSDVKF